VTAEVVVGVGGSKRGALQLSGQQAKGCKTWFKHEGTLHDLVADQLKLSLKAHAAAAAGGSVYI
jgi:hypothetical protein